MAKKKIPDSQSALETFKQVIERANLSNYYSVNNILLSNPDDSYRILIVPDVALWNMILDTDSINHSELDITDPVQYSEQQWFNYVSDINNEMWMPIEVTEDLFSGKVFEITIKDHCYTIPINKELLPLKLRKAEYTDISYRVFTKPNLILGIQKRFKTFADYDFSIIRLFRII